jgi:DNA-binding XRE family transcriptional regulator
MVISYIINYIFMEKLMEQITVSEVLSKFNNSQTELANAIGVSRQAVNKWLSNNSIPLLRQYQLKDIIANQENASE